MKLLLAITIVFLWANQAVGQVSTMSVKDWADKLSDPENDRAQTFYEICDKYVYYKDTAKSNSFLKQLEESGNNKNLHFISLLNCLKAAALTTKDKMRSSTASKSAAMLLMKTAMQQANESNDDYLAAFVSKFFLVRHFSTMKQSWQ